MLLSGCGQSDCLPTGRRDAVHTGNATQTATRRTGTRCSSSARARLVVRVVFFVCFFPPAVSFPCVHQAHWHDKYCKWPQHTCHYTLLGAHDCDRIIFTLPSRLRMSAGVALPPHVFVRVSACLRE